MQRILLKLSGEALSQDGDIISPKVLSQTIDIIKSVLDKGVQLGIVIGGGNILRGETFAKIGANKITGDHMGMMATVINGLAINDACNRNGVKSSVMSAVAIGGGVASEFDFKLAKERLSNNEVVIFVAGTGSPCFTTDSAASLRAIEIGADMLFKATGVDGVYTTDPKKDKSATKYDKLSFDEAINKNLAVMDTSAFAMCRENNLDICVFNMTEDTSTLSRILGGEKLGTIISNNC
jgi:uridylate kinase